MNGLRLRFDGADQRLRIIEVTNFHRSRLSYNGSELVRDRRGPTFRFIYNKLFGPTYAGEYLQDQGIYILSYPGISFAFPVDKGEWKDDVDFVSLLSASTAHSATSMAIFHGQSWSEARNQLFTKPAQNPRSTLVTPGSAKQSTANDEIEMVRILNGAKVELVRRYNPTFVITLHSTSPQDLVTELGPPTSIYHKNDHRLSIHRTRGHVGHAPDDTDDTEAEEIQSENEDDDDESPTSDYFYNYYNHGFDVFISTRGISHVATKIILHGNIPGSYEFQRYRRSRWILSMDDTCSENKALNSEMSFDMIYERLKEKFGIIQKPMLLNRGSDSPSSSVELLGGWEEGDQQLKGGAGAETTFGNTGTRGRFR